MVLCAGFQTGEESPGSALWRALRALPDLVRLGLWFGGGLVLVAVPFLLTGAGVANALLGAHDINHYL